MSERLARLEEIFFKGPSKEKEPLPEYETRSVDPYHGSCAPAWFTFPRAVVFLNILTVGAGKLLVEEVTAHEEEVRQQIAMETQASVERRQEQLLQKELQRIEGAFVDGAQTLREQPAFAEEFSKDQIEVFAQEFERFPVRRLLEYVAKASGRPLHEVAADNKVRVVELYTNQHIKTFVSRFETETGVDRDDKVTAELALGRAGVNVTARAILLNATEIAQEAGGDRERLRRSVQDVLVHEFLHGFDGMRIPQGRENAFYEGLTEALANNVGSALYPDRGAADPFAGYVDGATASAELVVAAVHDEALVWTSYLDGNLAPLGQAFDATYGDGAFRRALYFDQKTVFSMRYDVLAPVLGVLQEVGEDASRLISEANAHLSTGRIFTASVPGASSAVFLIGDGAASGILNGAVRFEKDGAAPQVALFLPEEPEKKAKPSSVTHVSKPVWRSGDTSVDTLSLNEVQERLNDLLEKEAERLALLGE